MLSLLFYIFIGLAVLQFLYWIGIYLRIALSKPVEKSPKRIPVSVILYVKNQMDEIVDVLPKILGQQYHDFEVVIVNNASTDETLDICKEFASLYPNIRIVDVVNNEAFWGSKRYALTLGIKASRHEYLLFADCNTPIHSEHWLWQMSAQFTLNKTIVLGHTKYKKSKGIFNKWIRFEHTFTQMQSFAFSKWVTPYQLVAKNIGYKKEEFYKVSGFIDHMNEAQNEHELILTKIASTKNVAVCDQSQATLTISTPSNRKEWKVEKKRQLKLLKRMSFGAKFLHTFHHLIRLALIPSAIVLLCWLYQPIIVGAVWVFLFLMRWIIFSMALNKFNQKDIKVWYPLFEIFTIFNLIRWLPTYFSKSK